MRIAILAVALVSTLVACARSDDRDPTTHDTLGTTPATAIPSEPPAPATTQMPAVNAEACSAWRAIRDGAVEAADSGREPLRTQLLDALELLRDSQIPADLTSVDPGDMESLDYWFDPIYEYVAFSTLPEATADPSYVGDRDAFLVAVGVFDQYCNSGMS